MKPIIRDFLTATGTFISYILLAMIINTANGYEQTVTAGTFSRAVLAAIAATTTSLMLPREEV